VRGHSFLLMYVLFSIPKKNEGPIAPSLPPPLRRAVENIIKMHEYLPISFVHKMMVLVHDEISRQISFASSEFSDPQTSRPKTRRSVLEAFFVVEKIATRPNCCRKNFEFFHFQDFLKKKIQTQVEKYVQKYL
jgi:hypothetical protein